MNWFLTVKYSNAMPCSLFGVLFIFLLHGRTSLVLAQVSVCPDGNCYTEVQNQLLQLTTIINEMNLKQIAIHGALFGPRDCSDIRAMGSTTNGVYRIYPGSDDKRIETDVYCDLQSSTESWLVFQRRKDGSENFQRLYKEYKLGFGDLTGEFWLGNDKLSLLTMNQRYKLRVELEDSLGEKRYAEYSNFTVKPATDKFRLTVGGYSGNAGDSLSYHSGMQFSTKDFDNDNSAFANCAIMYRGAWWYKNCQESNLNGFYVGGSNTASADGIEWKAWRDHYYSYKTTEMKIAVY